MNRMVMVVARDTKKFKIGCMINNLNSSTIKPFPAHFCNNYMYPPSDVKVYYCMAQAGYNTLPQVKELFPWFNNYQLLQ